MTIIDLSTAANEIAVSLINSRSNQTIPPFFLMVGAGVSIPTIPLASEITQQLRDKCKGRNDCLNPPNDPQSAYSYWFEKAFPSGIERAKFLRSVVEGKSVSPGNFALLKLLSWEIEKRAAFNLALTTNFDDFIERSAKFLGLKYYVHAHPIALDQVDLTDVVEKQIVHLHGSYKFYNCKNTALEVEDLAKGQSSFELDVMDNFLTRLMPTQMPIVVGYSGWQNDSFMIHFRDLAKKRQLPRNSYWFCHSVCELDNFTDEIQCHPNLKFVVREQSTIDSVEVFEQIMERLPSSTFSSSGGLFSTILAEMNGDRNDSEDPVHPANFHNLVNLDQFEKPTESIILHQTWNDCIILEHHGKIRDAWNLVYCDRLIPTNDFESLVLLNILSSVANNLWYDRELITKIKVMAEEVQISEGFSESIVSKIREKISSTNADYSDEIVMKGACPHCGAKLKIGSKVLKESQVVNYACLSCSGMSILYPTSYNVTKVEKGKEVEYIRSLYGG